ncbi:unnamed protein product [Phaeothamnion confervicola]
MLELLIPVPGRNSVTSGGGNGDVSAGGGAGAMDVDTTDRRESRSPSAMGKPKRQKSAGQVDQPNKRRNVSSDGGADSSDDSAYGDSSAGGGSGYGYDAPVANGQAAWTNGGGVVASNGPATWANDGSSGGAGAAGGGFGGFNGGLGGTAGGGAGGSNQSGEVVMPRTSRSRQEVAAARPRVKGRFMKGSSPWMSVDQLKQQQQLNGSARSADGSSKSAGGGPGSAGRN